MQRDAYTMQTGILFRGGNEAYAITDAPVFTLYATYDSDMHKLRFDLDYKEGGDGPGGVHWSGAIEASKLPVVLHIHLDKDHYQIRADGALETFGGALSGPLALHAYAWEGPVHFGITTFLNGGHGSSRVLIRRIRIEPTP